MLNLSYLDVLKDVESNHACHKHHHHWVGAHYLTKASCEISVSSLIDFLSKGRKSAKTAYSMHNYAS